MEKLGLMSFYRNKRVFITGHTGFKGSWLTKILVDAGAQVTGYALQPPTQPNLFSILNLGKAMQSVIGDVRDLEKLKQAFNDASPEIVFHLAAQPIVRDSYKEPVYTFETNIMGTVHILECVRKGNTAHSFLNITTDKVYENKEWAWGYRENDPLDGYDPYSNSKSCSELVTHSYQKSFFQDGRVAISTARAGNVIGGGDFANDRIIPDAVRAALKKENFVVRNPYSTRPYQHVLEPLYAYLMIAKGQYEDSALAGAYNVGPDECDCITTGELSTLFCQSWGEGMAWENGFEGGPHESSFLKLDCSKLKMAFGWKPVWHAEKAVEQTVAWAKAYRDERNTTKLVERQIQSFMKEASKNIVVEERKQYAGKKDRETGEGRNITVGI